jgi:hypothetical protein
MGKAVGLERVDIAPAGNDIFPRGSSAALTRDDVIEGEVGSATPFAGILAGVLIAYKDILTVKLDLGNGEAIVISEDEDFWHDDTQAHGMDQGLIGTGLGIHRVSDPFPGIKRRKVSATGVDHASMVLPKETEGPTHTDDVDRLPIPVEDKRPAIRLMGEFRGNISIKSHLDNGFPELAKGNSPVNVKAVLTAASLDCDKRQDFAFVAKTGMEQDFGNEQSLLSSHKDHFHNRAGHE